MKLTSNEIEHIKSGARIANAFASALESDDPYESAKLNGWTPEKMRNEARSLFFLAHLAEDELGW